MFIGITGTSGAGKSTVAEFFSTKQFKHYSSSGLINEYLDKENLEHNRDNMIYMGRKLRETYGNDFVVDTFMKRAGSEDTVMESIRSLGEVEKLKENNGILISVDALVDERYRRIFARKSSKDHINLETFRKQEEKELYGKGGGQQIIACMKKADYNIQNDGTLEELAEKLENLHDELKDKPGSHKRISWDEYFMKMAFLASERSTCRRHHVGAVIVKNKQVLSTGYNGAASGVKDCLELGCLRDELNIASGTRHEICRAIHAEQNAIIQGARNGVSIEDATLYCTHSPCILCAKMIVNSKIKRVVSSIEYADKSFKDLFDEARVEYDNMPIPSLDIELKE